MEFDEILYMKEMDIFELECFPFDNMLMMESTEEAIHDSNKGLIGFIEKLIKSIGELISRLCKNITHNAKEKHTKSDIKKLREKLKANKSHGVYTVQFYDVWEYEKIVTEAMKKLDSQTKGFMRKYNSIGQSLASTDKMIDKVTSEIEEYNKKLDKIKDKKITVPIDRLLDWVDDQISKGRPEVFSFVDEYQAKLKEYRKMVEEFDKKAEEYAQKTGQYRRPTKLTQHLKNMTTFVTRNINWIGTIGGGAALTLISTYAERAEREETKKEVAKEEPPRGDSMLYNDHTVDADARDKIERADTKNPKKTRLTNMGKLVGVGLMVDGFGRETVKAFNDRRNSV